VELHQLKAVIPTKIGGKEKGKQFAIATTTSKVQYNLQSNLQRQHCRRHYSDVSLLNRKTAIN